MSQTSLAERRRVPQSGRQRAARWLPRRRVPVLLQLNDSECGAACLAMVLSYHGRNYPRGGMPRSV